MSDTCNNCGASADPSNAKACLRSSCGLSLLLSGPDRLQRKQKADLYEYLTPERLYHAFTGENDPYELARVANLDHALQATLLEKVANEWPARLQRIAEQRRQEKHEAKQAVQQFILGINQ